MGHLASDLAGAGGLMAGRLAGAGGMLVSSLAAGLAVNSQWFTPAAATGETLSVPHKVTHLVDQYISRQAYTTTSP